MMKWDHWNVPLSWNLDTGSLVIYWLQCFPKEISCKQTGNTPSIMFFYKKTVSQKYILLTFWISKRRKIYNIVIHETEKKTI